MSQKTNCQGRRPSWLNRVVWLDLRSKKGIYCAWKRMQATQVGYNDVMRHCEDKTRRDKVQLGENRMRLPCSKEKWFATYYTISMHTSLREWM